MTRKDGLLKNSKRNYRAIFFGRIKSNFLSPTFFQAWNQIVDTEHIFKTRTLFQGRAAILAHLTLPKISFHPNLELLPNTKTTKLQRHCGLPSRTTACPSLCNKMFLKGPTKAVD